MNNIKVTSLTVGVIVAICGLFASFISHYATKSEAQDLIDNHSTALRYEIKQDIQELRKEMCGGFTRVNDKLDSVILRLPRK